MANMGDNYQDLRKKIHMFFDNELDTCDCEDLLSKVNNDKKCESMFLKEKNFREFVKSHIKRPSVSIDLLSNIKSSIKID